MMLCLTGLPRCGKDTAADHLVKEFGFFKTSFGAGIYEEAAPAFGVSIADMQTDHWKKNDVPELALANCTDQEFVNEVMKDLDDSWGNTPQSHLDYLMNAPRSSRFILQRWATEYRREQNPLYWVQKVDRQLAYDWNGQQDIVISDLREMHEYTYLHKLAGQFHMPFRVLEIMRAGTVGSAHSSDAGIPAHLINTRIENDSLDVYLGAISRTVKNIKRIV
jgi:hypothetical protein